MRYATIASVSDEYGAHVGFFFCDDDTHYVVDLLRKVGSQHEKRFLDNRLLRPGVNPEKFEW